MQNPNKNFLDRYSNMRKLEYLRDYLITISKETDMPTYTKLTHNIADTDKFGQGVAYREDNRALMYLVLIESCVRNLLPLLNNNSNCEIAKCIYTDTGKFLWLTVILKQEKDLCQTDKS